MIEAAKGLLAAHLRPATESVGPLGADSNGKPAAGKPAVMVAAPATAIKAAVWTAAPYCYRLSVLSDSLEVSARLKTADDLELLVRVLEAHKVLFAKADQPKANGRSEPEILTLT